MRQCRGQPLSYWTQLTFVLLDPAPSPEQAWMRLASPWPCYRRRQQQFVFVFWPYGPISRVTTPQSLQDTHSFLNFSYVRMCVCVVLWCGGYCCRQKQRSGSLPQSDASCWSDWGVAEMLYVCGCWRNAVVCLCFSGFLTTTYSAFLHREICHRAAKRFMSAWVL